MPREEGPASSFAFPRRRTTPELPPSRLGANLQCASYIRAGGAPVAWWDETGSVLGELADRVGPSVVGVAQRGTAGSGVVMEPGKVLTNAHNLRGDSVDVAFPGGTAARGRVVGADVDGDLGVIAVETGSRPALQPSPAAGSLSLGAPVFALSNPGGMGLRVSLGFVSGTERSFRGP